MEGSFPRGEGAGPGAGIEIFLTPGCVLGKVATAPVS